MDINIAFTRKIGAGFFGGEGFILQKLEGSGQAFIHSGGTIVDMTLGPGEHSASTRDVWWPSMTR